MLGKFLLALTVIYATVTIFMFSFVMDEWKAEKHRDFNTRISEGEEIKHICRDFNCVYFVENGNTYIVNGTKSPSELIIKGSSHAPSESMLGKLTTVRVYSNCNSGNFVAISHMSQFKFYAWVVVGMYFAFVALTFIAFLKHTVNTKIQGLVDGAERKSSLHSKNMSMLAEQLHHELNTPLSVVKELSDQINNAVSDIVASIILQGIPSKWCPNETRCAPDDGYLKGLLVKSEELSKKHAIINDNIKQSFVVLERMADAKRVRYSSGSKSLYDVVSATFNVAAVFNRSNCVYEIDPVLKEYAINPTFKLSNHEVMNILMNHVKNSLEANSRNISMWVDAVYPSEPSDKDKMILSMIESFDKIPVDLIKYMLTIFFSRFLDRTLCFGGEFIKILLVDNGNGVPAHLQSSIFNLNASSKAKDGEVRGAGLYLNREIARACGGDILLYESSSQGTTFLLKFPVIKLPKEQQA